MIMAAIRHIVQHFDLPTSINRYQSGNMSPRTYRQKSGDYSLYRSGKSMVITAVRFRYHGNFSLIADGDSQIFLEEGKK